MIPKSKPTPAKLNPTVDATYEIGVATSPSNFNLPDIPIAPGVITNPQVPAESCVFLPNRRFAPVNLEDGKPQFRLTQMKGTHELFGINVEHAGGFADIKFKIGRIIASKRAFFLTAFIQGNGRSRTTVWTIRI